MKPLILVTGANGYIASRLIPRLLEHGYPVRALAREPKRLRGRAWLPDVEVKRGSTLDAGSLARAMQGVHTAYYLVHSMASGSGYAEIERQAAHRFAGAADAAGLQHIIYLGGLADPNARNLAPHMRSRIETGRILREGRVPVTEFRAGVIVGAGSISFEMIRFLTECFPLLPGPTWLRNQSQPISAVNVIDYLTAAIEADSARGGIYEMGGPERMPYARTMLEYARLRNLRRLLLTLPGIPIALMARFVDWLTPVPYPIATALVGGLQSDSIVMDHTAQNAFPGVKLIPYETAVKEALQDLVPAPLERVWEGMDGSVIRMRHEGFFVDFRRITVQAAADRVFFTISQLGRHGDWMYASWLWRLRGWIDKLIPGRAVGQRRASDERDQPLSVGDRIGYYRVEAIEPGRLLRLHSELRAPGEGWLEWQIQSQEAGAVMLTQTVLFAPHGMPGFLYWFALAPFHRLVFRGLLRAFKRRSESA